MLSTDDLLHVPRSVRQHGSVNFRIILNGRDQRVELDEVQAEAQVLSDDEVREIARIAVLSEQHAGCPQDTEWAIDHAGNVFLLQSRPETVWSNKPRQAVGGASGMEGILKTLMTPVRVRPAG